MFFDGAIEEGETMHQLIDLLLLLSGLSGLYLGLGMLAAVMEKGARLAAQYGRPGAAENWIEDGG